MRPTLEGGRSRTLDAGAVPGGEGGFIEGSGGEAEDGLRGGFFGGGEARAVHFEEEDTEEEAGPFVAIEEGVVADNTDSVGRSQVYDVRFVAISMELPRSGKSGLKQTDMAHAGRTTVEGEKAVMEREGIALVDPNGLTPCPDRFTHVARPVHSFGERVQGVAVAANDVLGLFHFLFEGRIVGCELIGTVRAFDQKEAITFTGLQAADGFLGENDAEGIANFAKLEFEHVVPFLVITIVTTF
jgi:hypothetical protein